MGDGDPFDRDAFLAAAPEVRRDEAAALLDLFGRVTGFAPRLWMGRIAGFGRYHYRYDSGREGNFLATGFAMGKARISVHILPGYADHGAILDRLGPHRTGKSCVYITRLARVDEDVLAELIRAGLRDLDARWPVQPT